MSRAYFHMVGSGLKGIVQEGLQDLKKDLKEIYTETKESIKNDTEPDFNDKKVTVSCSQKSPAHYR